MLLRCRIPLASFELDINVSFEARVTAIFGPSGSGKTTLLDAVAGLRRVADGEIEIGGRILFSSERKINLPPREQRHRLRATGRRLVSAPFGAEKYSFRRRARRERR